MATAVVALLLRDVRLSFIIFGALNQKHVFENVVSSKKLYCLYFQYHLNINPKSRDSRKVYLKF